MRFPRAQRKARADARERLNRFHEMLSRALAYYAPSRRDESILHFSDMEIPPHGFLPLANKQVRRASTYILISEMLKQYQRVRRDRSVRTFLATFAWDAGRTPITGPVVNLEAMERSVRRHLLNLGLNAVCAFDIDIFSKPLTTEDVPHLQFHIHAVCWTRDATFQPRNTARRLCGNRAFPNLHGAPSVNFTSRAKSATNYAGFQLPRPSWNQCAESMGHLGHYLLKDTVFCKNRYKGRTGRMIMRSDAGRYRRKTALRFAEIYSQISPYDAVFAVGREASVVAAGYAERLRRWERRNRERGNLCIEQVLADAWTRLFTDYPQLGYAPSRIRQRRHTLAASRD